MSEMRFSYPASISQITSVNDSFDSCILSICYAGRNRNRTFISKEAIENAIPTMAYCPIVANYDVESDIIGGHDVDFVDDDTGSIKMVNLTDAVGVIPENPQWCWQLKMDKDGVEREYLSTPAILWKRTPVYDKLKRDGVSGQSMEINVRDGKIVDGLYEIDSFEFTAFCLLGEDIEPCFEGAQVEMFSLNNLSSRLSEMMSDFKDNFTKVIAASADDDKTPKGEEYCLEGGESSLKMDELLQKYGLTEEDIDFDTIDMTEEDIEARFAELQKKKFADDDNESGADDGEGSDDDQQDDGDQDDGADDTETDPEPEDDDDDEPKKQYSLTGMQLKDEILNALYAVSYKDEWGEWPRYCFTDYDPAVNEVYAYDNEDWNLYGFKYSMNGDKVVIDFESKSRKRLAFVDFDEGDDQFNYAHMFDSANVRFDALTKEVVTLRDYKKAVEAKEFEQKANDVFARFSDLADDERFKLLRDNCSDMSIEDIEDKCFAIRGRNTQVKFSQNNNPIRLPVEGKLDKNDADEPYGGVFVEFGIGNR